MARAAWRSAAFHALLRFFAIHPPWNNNVGATPSVAQPPRFLYQGRRFLPAAAVGASSAGAVTSSSPASSSSATAGAGFVTLAGLAAAGADFVLLVGVNAISA